MALNLHEFWVGRWIFVILTSCLEQGSQYRIDNDHTDWYVLYRYVYQYQNINILYWFKYWPCIGHISQFQAIPTGIEIFFFFSFLSFVIFEFLLGQNGNLFALIY